MDDCFPKSKFHTPPTPPAGKEFSVTVTMCVCVCDNAMHLFLLPFSPSNVRPGWEKECACMLAGASTAKYLSVCVCVCVFLSLSPSRANQLGHD